MIMKFRPWFLNFDFSGRSRRSHYWANIGCWLLFALGWFLLMMAATALPEPASNIAGVPLVIIGMAAIVINLVDGLAMLFRRAHDTSKSGWIMLLLLVPFVNFLALYWLLIQDSDEGANKYGPPVKAFARHAAA